MLCPDIRGALASLARGGVRCHVFRSLRNAAREGVPAAERQSVAADKEHKKEAEQRACYDGDFCP